MKLFGKNQVFERINTKPRTVKRIYIEENKNADIAAAARRHNISTVFLPAREFARLSGLHRAQGVIAEIEEFGYSDLNRLLAAPLPQRPVFIALSNITDPQNLGSILRTCACFGGFAVIIPGHRSAAVTESVLKVACGGENYVPVVRVTNLIPAFTEMKNAGYWIAGAVVRGGEDMARCRLPFPLCLVIGAEDKGIREGITKHLDLQVSLLMAGAPISLNAAVAAAICCYEITRRRFLLTEANP